MKWISVKDRLPEEGKIVLVKIANEDHVYTCYRSVWHNKKRTPVWCHAVDEWSCFNIDLVSHWIEIPPLPKETDEKS